MPIKSLILTGLILSVLVCLDTYAQEAHLEGVLPDSIVVTATREAADQRSTGRRITVWTARQLADLPVSSFDELLRAVGGVETQSRGGFGVQSDITMRGSTFNGVLVLVDGMRLNDPMTGHFLADLPVPLSEIARIEVLRGPASALYGPDALGGVIQIITYTGLQTAGEQPLTQGSADLQFGDEALYSVDASLRHAQQRTVVSAATTFQGTDGMPIQNAEGTPVLGPDGAIRTDFTRQAHSLAVHHQSKNVGWYARAGFDDREFGAFHFYTPFASDTAREATSTYWAQVRLGGAGRTPWQIQVAAKQHEDAYTFYPGLTPNEHTSRLLQAQAQLQHALHTDWHLIGGVSGALRSIDSNNMGKHDDAAAGAFVTTRWNPQTAWTLHTSGRLDYDPGFGLEATPQISVAYNPNAMWTLRGGISRAVRAPNYVERYFNTVRPRPNGNLGNPDLEAERAWAYEAGADVYTSMGLSLHATGFIRHTSNLIDYVQLTPADTLFLARNVLNVDTRGIELDAAFSHDTGTSRWRVDATYTWLDADLGNSDGVHQFKYALSNARHIVQGQATLTQGATTLGLQAFWKERLEGDSYSVVNARLAYRINWGAQRLILSAEVRNLFDETYSEVFDAPMPGRWWLVGMTLTR